MKVRATTPKSFAETAIGGNMLMIIRILINIFDMRYFKLILPIILTTLFTSLDSFAKSQFDIDTGVNTSWYSWFAPILSFISVIVTGYLINTYPEYKFWIISAFCFVMFVIWFVV